MLERFAVNPDDRLGGGGESQVYALDRERVLRIYKQEMPAEYVEQRHQFYAQLQELQPPFEVPQIYETGVIQGQIYTVERRMHGRDFGAVLPTLTGTRRQQALASYFEVATQIGTLTFPTHPFGEVISMGTPIRCATWPDFLAARMQQTLQASRADVEQDCPQIDAVVAALNVSFQQMEHVTTKGLVHGDYFPANVFIDDDLRICGVGDFGYTTVIGDGRMDVTGAIVYLEILDIYRPADVAYLSELAIQHYGPQIEEVIWLYRLYYSVYFSYCKTGDPGLYAWCIRNLKAHPAAS